MVGLAHVNVGNFLYPMDGNVVTWNWLSLRYIIPKTESGGFWVTTACVTIKPITTPQFESYLEMKLAPVFYRKLRGRNDTVESIMATVKLP